MLKHITKFTQKIEYLAAKTSLVYHIISRYYHDVIKKEINLANITENDRILCIGGGFCPFSAILLHQATGAKVTVIDNNSKCIPKAREVIERLRLDENIRLLCQDGCCKELSLSEYSIVHFALQVTPMEYVFAEIERKVPPGTKILIRRPKAHLNNMYCRLSNTLLTCCRYIVHKKSSNIGSTVLYVKQGSAA